MRHFILSACALFSALSITAQSTQDLQSIRSMCGCYKVDFEFAETFSPDTNYVFQDNYSASALEWVQMIEDNGSTMRMQHILVIQDMYTVKHWRQDWIYQPKESFDYVEGRTWKLTSHDPMTVAGRWEQRVFQVDDSPRYASVGTWIHADGRHFWEANARTPLPRREYTKRSDYDVMDRRNRHEIHDAGWTHEQDNLKVQLDGENEIIIAEEKGRNTYTRVDDERCQMAVEYWTENKDFWSEVRDEWGKHMQADNDLLQLRGKVEGKPPYVYFMDHPTDEISSIIESFIITEE
ncbi:MAG TPA: hypothetical protein DD635_09035 [Flavobacteriales bacterium]|nr:hypothetical protein [Flavobacteriales bacterium]